MIPWLPALRFAFGAGIAPTLAAAAAENLPPIFNPPPAVPPAISTGPRMSRTGMSERMRTQLTERILADAHVFEAPAPPTPTAANATVSGDGVLVMPRVIVRSFAPRRDEVELPPPPIEFHPVKRIEQKRHGLSATLFQFLDGNGSFNLNVVNGAGSGVDHARQFTRVELEFSLKW